MTLKLHLLQEGEGRPIVLLHGFMGSGLDWQSCVDERAFPRRPTYAFDLPAHGESDDFEGEWGFVEAVEAVLDTVPLDGPFDLVGYSLGGRLALYLAGTNPGRIERLALIGANPGIEHPQDRVDRQTLDSGRAALLAEAPDVFVSEWAELDLFGPATSAAWKALRQRRADAAPASGYRWARALTSLSVGRQLLLWNVPYLIEKRTLFIAGARDEKYVEVAREFRNQNPDHVELAFIVAAHHAPHLDRPDAVAEKLRDFF